MIARHRLHRNFVLCCCGFSVLIATAAHGQEVRDTSYVAPDGSRVLQQSIVVPATARQVWDAFTTTEGLRVGRFRSFMSTSGLVASGSRPTAWTLESVRRETSRTES